RQSIFGPEHARLPEFVRLRETDFSSRIHWVANFQCGHPVDELVKKLFVNFVCNEESLCRDARLFGGDGGGFDCLAQRAFEIRAWHHDKCIAPAQLEHTFFDLTCGRARHRAPRFFAACQRDRLYTRVDNYLFDLLWFDEERLENAVIESRAAKYLFNGKCALRHIGRMLQQTDVSSY